MIRTIVGSLAVGAAVLIGGPASAATTGPDPEATPAGTASLSGSSGGDAVSGTSRGLTSSGGEEFSVAATSPAAGASSTTAVSKAAGVSVATGVSAAAGVAGGPVGDVAIADRRPQSSGYAPPRSRLTLTYAPESGQPTAVQLTCYPTGGGHPEAAQACDTLKTTDANPGKIKPAQVMCMMLYAPVTARITGVWRGEPVKWVHKYGNTCEMKRATGVLFKF